MDNIRWKVTDPFGKKIVLSEYNFVHHIIEQHDPRDAEIRSKIEPQAKFAIEHPRFIIRDNQRSGRVKYLSLVDIAGKNEVQIRTIAVVVEAKGEVVTWFARRTINDNLEKEDVIYDARNNDLQV